MQSRNWQAKQIGRWSWFALLALALVACDQKSDQDSGVVVIESDLGGPRILEPDQGLDGGAAPVDAAPVMDTGGGIMDTGPTLDQGPTLPDAADMGAVDMGATVSNPFGADGGMSLDAPECGEEPNCTDACRWVASCATGEACPGFQAEDLPLIYRFCLNTCETNQVFPEFVCGHATCDQSVGFMNNIIEFRTACAGDGELTIPEPMVDPGVEACLDLVGCINQCADEQCANQCVNMAEPDIQMRLFTIFECAQTRGCVNAAGSIDVRCMEQNCPDEWAACFGPPVQAMGLGGCGDLLLCFNGCPQNEQQCFLDCVAEASPEAFGLYNAALACVDASGCPPNDFACQQMRCAAEIMACQND